MSSTTTVPAPARRVVFSPRADAVLRQIAVPTAVMTVLYVVLHALLLSRFPWFIDEAFYGLMAQNVQGSRAGRFSAQIIDHKGLINSWIGGVMVRLGIPPIDAVRLIATISGAIAAVATGWIVGRWRSITDGLIAAALVAFIPYMFVHDTVGIYDAYITAGSMLALALQISLAGRVRLDRMLLLGFVWGMLMLSKPTGAITIALAPFSLVLFDWSAPHRRRRLVIWASAMVLAVVIAAAMYALTGLSPTPNPAPDNHRTLGDFFANPFGTLGDMAPGAARAFLGYLSWPGVAIALWGIVRVVRTRDRLGILLTIWAAAAIVIYLVFTDNAYPRYGLQAVPPLCAMMVVGGRDLWDRARRRWSVRVVAAVAFALALQAIVLDVRVLAEPRTAPYPGLDRDQYVGLVSNRQPVREATDLILKRAPAAFTLRTTAAERTVADLGGWSWGTTIALNGTKWTASPRFLYVDQNSPHDEVNAARFVIVEGTAPAWLDVSKATLVRRWTNPGTGWTTVLYDRGA